MLAYITWDVSPKLFELFGREIRWYGLCWAIGLLLAVLIIQKIYQSEKLPQKWFDSLFVYVVVSLIIGARVGHCLFYDPVYYLTHPLEMLKIWEGGLASHGGAIGIIIGTWLYSKKIHKTILWTLDRVVVAAGLTGACIRFGNLMNSEIYGKATTLPWGFEFVRDPMWSRPLEMGGSGGLPCHPTQIYEALVYLVIFGVAMYLFWKTNAKQKEGLIFGVCITAIFLARFCLEYLKNVQEPFELQMRATIGMDMGQLLSLPFVLIGGWLIYRALNRKEKQINK
ncbi:MAG: prolipoprotein diacylglyceryl transferase [Dysgonomonas sp.]|nr:prolipoprotein diacylglyceryl transferase [Dysgonomonas sp.]